MARLHSSLRPELRGQHPRVYVTESGLSQLRDRARTTHVAVWQRALEQVRALKKEAPPAPAQERRVQNEVGIGIAEAALAYKIEGDPKYLEAAKRYLEAGVSYDVWGYLYNKPNVDLAAGHLLYGMGWGYDLLYHDLTEAERVRYREALTKHARLLFDYYEPQAGKTYTYSQNHVFIPMAGLGVAAYALYDEVPDAPEWAKLSRAIYDRVLETYSADGYYYEAFEYWIFSTPWLVHYLDAHAHATGEDLYDRPGFRRSHEYIAHSMLPDGKYVFDFGDIYEGPLTRAKHGDEYLRANPNGQFHVNYNILYRFASKFNSPEAQGVAAWMESLQQYNAENYWSLFWYDANVPVLAIEKQPSWHYFPDHEVVYWRSDWTPNATAFAFKCGPPEGHHSKGLYEKYRDWEQSTGHAQPDANSFIIYAGGSYLTGDSGYAGVSLTEHHNTMRLNGKGQAREGKGHDAFEGIPYERLDRIRIEDVKVEANRVYIRGNADAAYEPELGLTRFNREFVFNAPDEFVITDDLAASQASQFSVLLHADERVESSAANQFLIKAGASRLHIDVDSPSTYQFGVEPNIVTSAGLPGSVDQGERQQRGERLAVTNASPATQVRTVMRLKVQGRAP